jgi:hypothetical protein
MDLRMHRGFADGSANQTLRDLLVLLREEVVESLASVEISNELVVNLKMQVRSLRMRGDRHSEQCTKEGLGSPKRVEL